MIKANKRNFLFEEVKQTAPERNGFDLSHENKQTCRANKIYPFEIFEALPGDDFELSVEQFVRLQPSLSPTMHRIKAYWHWFFVPNRLCNNHWEEFISRGNGQKLPANQDYIPPEMPYITYLDLIRYSPAVSNLLSVYSVGNTVSGYSTVELMIEGLSNRFPELLFKDYSSGSNSPYKVAIFVRTPRLANAMQIPDTALPLYYIDSDNKFQEASPIAASQPGTVTVNTLANYNNGLNNVDVLTYFNSVKISLLPFVAVLRNWLEYYRDENLDDDLHVMFDYFFNLTGRFLPTTATEKSFAFRLFALNYRCWEKDYFTTATQLPQKAPDVEIPGTGASSSGSFTAETTISAVNSSNTVSSGFNGNYTDDNAMFLAGGAATFNNGNLYDSTHNKASYHYHDVSVSDIAQNLQAETTVSGSSDSSTLQPTTVAQVRRAFALQRWFEKAVRTGTRYIESLKAFFNSDAGDARLQRSEYIGGSSSPVQISDVVQTSATDDNSDTVQGNLAGYGIVSDTSEFCRYHCPEHGFVIGMFSILGRTSYCQGIPRMYLRPTWLDYAWPEFEHIGEQGVKQIELFAAPLTKDIMQTNFSPYTASGISYNALINQTPEEIFGYQSRYSEYKQVPDRFGSGFSSSLDFWSLGRIFASKPTLSPQFVHSNLSDRNFAVVGNDRETPAENPKFVYNAQPDQYDESYDFDTYICDFWVNCKKVTSLTLYSEPI